MGRVWHDRFMSMDSVVTFINMRGGNTAYHLHSFPFLPAIAIVIGSRYSLVLLRSPDGTLFF